MSFDLFKFRCRVRFEVSAHHRNVGGQKAGCTPYAIRNTVLHSFDSCPFYFPLLKLVFRSKQSIKTIVQLTDNDPSIPSDYNLVILVSGLFVE